MKNTSFFDHMKCIMRNECNNIENGKTEIKKEEVIIENVKQDTAPKMNFQLFDIDQIFAN